MYKPNQQSDALLLNVELPLGSGIKVEMIYFHIKDWCNDKTGGSSKLVKGSLRSILNISA